MRKSFICLLMMLVLSSCSYFSIRRPVIEQGNIITTEEVSKLHPGMSEAQVIEIMGEPMLENIFTPNRMEYVYTYQNGIEPRTEKRVKLFFKQGRLEAIH
jgi:outer membrane protein assembly factor BamE